MTAETLTAGITGERVHSLEWQLLLLTVNVLSIYFVV